jgi:hypothetical protein
MWRPRQLTAWLSSATPDPAGNEERGLDPASVGERGRFRDLVAQNNVGQAIMIETASQARASYRLSVLLRCRTVTVIKREQHDPINSNK